MSESVQESSGSSVGAVPGAPRNLDGLNQVLLSRMVDDSLIRDVDRALVGMIHRRYAETRPVVLAAMALASRAVADGHSCLNLSDLDGLTIANTDGAPLITFPSRQLLVRTLDQSPAIGREGEHQGLPFVRNDADLYLYRYWRYEKQIANWVSGRIAEFERSLSPERLDVAWTELRAAVDRVRGSDEYQAKPETASPTRPAPRGLEHAALAQGRAVALAALSPFVIITGGPGTGKTTIAAQIVALHAEMLAARASRLAPADDRSGVEGPGRAAHPEALRAQRIAVAAPTGKGAVRLQESITRALARVQLSDKALPLLPREATTIHRLLGAGSAQGPGGQYRYRGDRKLPLDVLVVDEASMIDVELMAALLEALASDTRLVLLGDPQQLASVEAGTVLGDLVGVRGPSSRTAGSVWLHEAVDELVRGGNGPPARVERAETSSLAVTDLQVKLDTRFRFGGSGGLLALADAIESGDPNEVERALDGGSGVRWQRFENQAGTQVRGEFEPEVSGASLNALVEVFLNGYAPFIESLRSGERPEAVLGAFNQFRVLAPFRGGEFGTASLNRHLDLAIRARLSIDSERETFPGQTFLVVRNHYEQGLFNGDTGVILAAPSGHRMIAHVLAPDGALRTLSIGRLPAVEPAWALTVHKAQGSEFDSVGIVLPEPPEPNVAAERARPHVTRELLYTAVTRARSEVDLAASKAAVSAAVLNPLRRTSGLANRFTNQPS